MSKSKVNFQHLPWTPEGKLERQLQADLELRQQYKADAERRRQEFEDRLDAPITRRELLVALERVRSHAGCNVSDYWDAIETIFRNLITELE